MPVGVVPVEGVFLNRILDEEYAQGNRALSRMAYGRFDAAQMRTAWGSSHLRRFALMSGDEVLASAKQYQLTGALDHRPVRICGIGSVFAYTGQGSGRDAGVLVERLLHDAARDGMDMAVLLCDMDTAWCDWVGFERLVMTDVEVGIAQSPRHGAPMTLIRAGEERDLAAIAEMGEPIEHRPVIRGWLPPRFAPPQVTILSTTVCKGGDGALAHVDGDAPATHWRRRAVVARRCRLNAVG